MIELIAGGARSGKSTYALQLAEGCSSSPVFVATATAGDHSMADRIARHQAERGSHWRLVEEPFRLSRVMHQHGKDDVLLVDCLTLWVSNWVCLKQPARWKEEKQKFLDELEKSEATVYLVSNEVGMGVIPVGALNREFVDESGWLHQSVAAMADRVTMMHFGIPHSIKE